MPRGEDPFSIFAYYFYYWNGEVGILGFPQFEEIQTSSFLSVQKVVCASCLAGHCLTRNLPLRGLKRGWRHCSRCWRSLCGKEKEFDSCRWWSGCILSSDAKPTDMPWRATTLNSLLPEESPSCWTETGTSCFTLPGLQLSCRYGLSWGGQRGRVASVHVL